MRGGERTVEREFVVRDRCTACDVSHIDIQLDVLERFWAKKDVGRVSATWEWLEGGSVEGE
jgi:hypothetical protein